MPFIGKQPEVGAYSKLDAITTSATATYNLTLDSGAYYPTSANHLLVSLNGVMQAPQDSFTVSGSTIVFASTLASTDSIDFIMALGDVLDIGTPSDGTVTSSKLVDGTVTSSKLNVNAITPITRDTSNNRIGIGNTSPDRTVSIKHASQAEVGFKTGSVSNGALIYYNDSENKLLLRAQESGERIEFQTGGNTARASITDDGICFGTDTAAANALDDYEVGTWTPTVNGLSGAASGYGNQVGHYTKIGNIVVAYFRFTLTNKGNISGNYALIQGLPFNHSGSDGGSGMVNRYTNLVNAVSSLGIELGGSSPSVAWLTKQSGTSGTSDTYVTTADIANNTFMQGTLIYRTG